MKRMTIIVLVVLFAAGMAFAKEYTATKTAGGYRVSMTIDKDPPVLGDNNVTIAVKDPSGKDVTDAMVSIEYSMPAMPGMPAMNYKTATTLKGTEYQGKMKFSMYGAWKISVKVSKGGKIAKAIFNVEVH